MHHANIETGPFEVQSKVWKIQLEQVTTCKIIVELEKILEMEICQIMDHFKQLNKISPQSPHFQAFQAKCLQAAKI